MPYVIVKHEEDGKTQWCVHDKREDGSPGENRGCSDSEEMAQAHMRAMYAHHGEKGDITPLPEWESEAVVGDVQAVKAVGDWELDVLGVPYGGPHGGKDAQGEYFAADTNLHEDKYGLPPVVYYHGMGPDGRPMGDPQYIGKTVTRERRADGVWYRVMLDKASEYAKRVWEAAQRGVARASSGSAGHLRRVDGDGHIRHWPVVELSIFDAVDGRQPANSYAVAVPVMKAVYQAAGMPLPVDIAEPEAEAKAAGDAAPQAVEAQPIKAKGVRTMDDNEMTSILAALEARQKANEAAEAKAKEDAAVKAELEAAKAELAELRRLPSGAPYVTKFNDRKYDGLDAGDLEFLIQTLTAPSNSTLVRQMTPEQVEVAAKSLLAKQREAAGKGDAISDMALKALPQDAIKANEVNYSTYSTFGSQWVGTAYSTRLWEKIRQGTFVVANLPSIEVPPGMSSIYVPLESTDPKFYKVAEATAIDSTLKVPAATVTNSPVVTGNAQLTLAKMGARVLWTGEMEEDSLIPWVSNLRRQLERAAAEQMEHVIIDGDTATSSNINDIGGTTYSGDATTLFLLVDGFRKSCLVTTTANSRSATTTLTADDYLETLKLMGAGGQNAADPRLTHFIIGPHVLWKTMELEEVKTRDVFVAPTIENGTLASIYGHPLHTSYFMNYSGIWSGAVTTEAYKLLAYTSGKVDLNTQSNNTTGSILAVRWDQWLLGWRRRMTVETTRIANADTTEIVTMLRFGLKQRDTEASAISYNVTV